MKIFSQTSTKLGMVALLPLFALTCAQAQTNESKDKSGSSSKEEGNRNVMLNAASANGPREIQIGLPSADVNVLENGLPVTYATNPHSVNSNWRSDASLSHVGLLKISETAIKPVTSDTPSTLSHSSDRKAFTESSTTSRTTSDCRNSR